MLHGESGIERSRTAIHNWVHEAEFQTADDVSPARVAVDQKTMRVDDERCWLYAVVDPATSRFLHIRLFPTHTIPIARQFLAELTEKHDVTAAVFLIEDASDLEAALRQHGFPYRVEIHGWRNSIERVFLKIARRTSSFSNCFSHVHPPTANS